MHLFLFGDKIKVFSDRKKSLPETEKKDNTSLPASLYLIK